MQEIEGLIEIDECRKCQSIANAICETNEFINRVDFNQVNRNGFAVPDCRFEARSNLSIVKNISRIVISQAEM